MRADSPPYTSDSPVDKEVQVVETGLEVVVAYDVAVVVAAAIASAACFPYHPETEHATFIHTVYNRLMSTKNHQDSPALAACSSPAGLHSELSFAASHHPC